MSNFSDAWFLTTLILLKSSSQWATLQQVIAGGDYINHAIFTYEEINHALSVLIQAQYVEINDTKQMQATDKTLSLCNKTFQKAGVLSKEETILKKLTKVVNSQEFEVIEYFSVNDIDQAYKDYVEMYRK